MINEFGGVIFTDELANRTPEEWEMLRKISCPYTSGALGIWSPTGQVAVLASLQWNDDQFGIETPGLIHMFHADEGREFVTTSDVVRRLIQVSDNGYRPIAVTVSPVAWEWMRRSAATWVSVAY